MPLTRFGGTYRRFLLPRLTEEKSEWHLRTADQVPLTSTSHYLMLGQRSPTEKRAGGWCLPAWEPEFPGKKPFLNAVQCEKRLKWAKEHASWASEQWKRVLWSDETRISFFGSVWVRFIRRRSWLGILVFYPLAHAAHTYSLDFVDSEQLLILIRLVGNVSIYNYSRFSC